MQYTFANAGVYDYTGLIDVEIPHSSPVPIVAPMSHGAFLLHEATPKIIHFH